MKNDKITVTGVAVAQYDDKRANTRDFQPCGILTSVDSEDPVLHPVRLINSKLCSVSLTLIESSSD